jgi:hypothetical protein
MSKMAAGDVSVRTRPALEVPFVAEAFPSALRMDGFGELATNWNDILWAAFTVGRPNLYYVLRYGAASGYEAIFRISLTKMAVEQAWPMCTWLQRTGAFKALDPTEKGAVSYFLGMTMCKLFAAKRLDTPWLLHLDAFGDQYGAKAGGRSRPDMIGQSAKSGEWTSFECKGRGDKPDDGTKRKAKEQAKRVSVNDEPCRLHVAAFTYFERDNLTFYWADPPAGGEPIDLQVRDEHWRHYYLPAIELFRAHGGFADGTAAEKLSAEVRELDLRIEVAPPVADALRHWDWSRARHQAMSHAEELNATGFQPDGLRIIAGESWRERLRWPSD